MAVVVAFRSVCCNDRWSLDLREGCRIWSAEEDVARAATAALILVTTLASQVLCAIRSVLPGNELPPGASCTSARAEDVGLLATATELSRDERHFDRD